MRVGQGIQTTFVLSFPKSVFYPKQTFFYLDFSPRSFDNVLTRDFLNFLFSGPWFTIYNNHFTNIANTRFFNKQLELGHNLKSYLYFQDFQSSNLFSSCSVLWLSKHTLIVFSDFLQFFIDMRYTVSKRSKQFVWN